MTPTKATTIIRLSAATCALALAAAIVARRADDWPLRLLYAGLLAVIVVTDLERCIIPNAITLPGTALAVLARGWPSVAGALVGLSIVAAPALALWLAPGKSTPLGVPHPWESHTPGTSQGHGAWGMGLARRPMAGVGQGDLKLGLMVGAIAGIGGVFPSMLIGTLAGALVATALVAARRAAWQSAIPYGPYLALAGAVALVR